MLNFSQRKGIKPPRASLQLDSMDPELRNSLWNLLDMHYWKRAHSNYAGYISEDSDISMLLTQLWFNHFKEPLDTMPKKLHLALQSLRDHFFRCEWNEVYDFIEFVANAYPERYARIDPINKKFIDSCNNILEREGAEVVSQRPSPSLAIRSSTSSCRIRIWRRVSSSDPRIAARVPSSDAPI